jgi:hypothetical protein
MGRTENGPMGFARGKAGTLNGPRYQNQRKK